MQLQKKLYENGAKNDIKASYQYRVHPRFETEVANLCQQN